MSRTYRRSLGTRLLAVFSALLLTGAAVWVAASAGPGVSLLILAGLSGLSLFNLAGALGDRYTLDPGGIEYRNGLLARLGRPPRRTAWGEVVSVREHRRPHAGDESSPPAALFLTLG
ncbi:MAG: hypothetical protein ACRD5D_04315, partial [Candidatus Polarisedimenticolia bacterium]